ncbi:MULTISPECIES: hypothetical protein [Tsukamurella]|nr:hypothetical protein [Tsukamurella conjunctivitidis]
MIETENGTAVEVLARAPKLTAAQLAELRRLLATGGRGLQEVEA